MEGRYTEEGSFFTLSLGLFASERKQIALMKGRSVMESSVKNKFFTYEQVHIAVCVSHKAARLGKHGRVK